jgi:[acyl-carrier-protein] S-malonyltransferase
VTSVACWHALLANWGLVPASSIERAGVTASAGLSLGEYTALHIAGAFSFEDGLELVTLRGRAMQDAAEAAPGGSGMVALIGADEPQAQAVCRQTLEAGPGNNTEVLVCANFNAPGQVVISGSRTACDRAVGIAVSMGLRATLLPVAGAFHSPLMAAAADRLAEALSRARISQPRCTVISNVTAAPHAPQAGASIDQTIRRRLVEQLTMPVRWSQGCAALIAQAGGQSAGASFQFHELAPGKTLAGLMRRIERSVRVETHDEPTAQHVA